MDLIKIAHSPEFSYLEKVATIVDEFAAGNIDGSTADAIAMDAGIDPNDLLSVYQASYGDMEKVAADEALDFLTKVANDYNATYLEKAAAVVDAFANGVVDGEEADQIAMNMGVDPEDVAEIFMADYGDGASFEKTAGYYDPVDALEKVAYEGGSYLEKAAAVVDAFAAGALTGDEADAIGMELGVEPEDLVSVYSYAYDDGLGKYAEDKKVSEEAKDGWWKKTKGWVGDKYRKTKNIYAGTAIDPLKEQLKEKGLDEKAVKDLKSQLLKARLKTHGARIGTALALGGAGYGAYRKYRDR